MKKNPGNPFGRLFLSSIAAPAFLVSTTSQTHAVTTYTGAGDDWADETNWTPNVAPDGPAGAFNQRLNFSGNTTVTFTAAQGTVDLAATAAADARAFAIGNTNGNPGTTSVLNITGGTLRTSSLANNTATGTTSLVAANGQGSNGTLNVSGTGTLDLTPALGSSQRILSLGLGATANTGISGTVNLSGNGLIKVSQLRFSESAPNAGGSITGVVNLNGGTLETGALQEATGTASALISSTVNLNGGLLRLTAATGISSSVDTVNVLSGANIEVPTGITAASGKDLLAVGVGGLTKSGDGILTLTGASTYTGATTINAGTLSAGNLVVSGGGSSLGNASSVVTLGSAGSQGTLSYSGNTATYTRGFTIGGAGGGRLDVTTSGQTLTLDTVGINGSGLFTVGGAGRTTINSALTHTGGLTKGPFITATTALTLTNGSNTYDGVTTISHGAIVVTANGALGSTSAGTETSAGSLALDNVDYSSAETLTGSGPGSGAVTGILLDLQRGFIQSKSGNSTFRGNIILGANGVSRIGSQNNASLTLTGTITQGAGVTTASILFRPGNGTLNAGGDFVTLTNSGNAFGGDSQVFTSAATGYSGVRLGIANALPTNLTISGLGGGTPTAAGTALDLNGFSQTLNGLTGAAILNIINTNTVTPCTLTLNPTADKSTAGTVILGGTGLSGPLGTINLIKDGTFSQTLAGVNTHTGATTINDGSLIVTGSLDPASAVTVNGGNLGGTGTVGGNVTVAAAGNLAPGVTAGTLSITGSLDISAMAAGAGKLKYGLDAIAGTNDQITVGGTLTLGAAQLGIDNLEITNLGGLQIGTYTLITSSSLSGTVNGTAALIAPGFNGQLLVTGNNLQLVVTAAGGYAAWQSANSTTQAINLDHDNDGVSNGVEYFIGGTNPTTGFNPLPGVSGNTVTWIKHSTYPNTAVYGTDFEVQTSTTLAGAWTGASLGAGSGQVVISGDNIIYTFPAGPKNFARLKVTGP